MEQQTEQLDQTAEELEKQNKPQKHYILGHPILWGAIGVIAVLFLSEIGASIVSALFTSGMDEVMAAFIEKVAVLILYTGIGRFLLYIAQQSYGSSFHIGWTKNKLKESICFALPAMIFIVLNVIPSMMDHTEHVTGLIPFLSAMAGAFAAGIGEELISRNFVIENAMQCWSGKSYRIKASLILSAVGFGVVHLINLASGAELGPTCFQVVYASALGFFFAAVYMRTRNLWGPILLHALIDATAFYFSGSDDSALLDPGSMIVVIVVCIILVICACYLVRKSKIQEIEELWADEENTIVRNRKKEKIIKIILGIVVAAIFAVILGLLGLQFMTNQEGKSTASQMDFTHYEMVSIDQSSTMTEEDLKDYKITVINMWETTCAFCIEEMPALEEVSVKYSDDVQIIGVCTDTVTEGSINKTKLEEAKQILATQNLTYPQMTPSIEMSQDTDKIQAYPLTIIVDSQGNILEAISGGHDQAEWSKIIDECLLKVN